MTDSIKTHIATFDEPTITVRGKDLLKDLTGKRSFTEMSYFLATGRFPTAEQTTVLDACLVTLMEHGLNSSTIITRLASDSAPDQVQIAMAAGLLAIGDVFAGTMEGCAKILQQGLEEIQAGADPEEFCRRIVSECKASKKHVPGFGHTTHRPDDPRTSRLFEIVEKSRMKGAYIDLLRRLGTAVDNANGRHLTINATGAIAAALLEIGVPVEIMRCFAVIARAGGLPGHILEEKRTRSARKIVELVRENTDYENPPEERKT